MRRALAAALVLLAAAARAETRTYVIAIGNNAPPPSTEALPELRYSDDDAADFYLLTRDLAREAVLLSVLDAQSQQRFPDLAARARPATLAELRRAVAELRPRFEADARAGHEPVLLFFYSGHGSRGGAAGPASLALLDGALTRELLYDEVLAALPARYVHLLVDACHAEAVVRPRDLDGEVVPLTAEDVRSYAAGSTLARFPHVGALVATASDAQAHEWDHYQRGVFSHQVLSGLRGAADVDGDGRIEYSELYAFLAAANREVVDPRARLEVVAQPPRLNRRAPIVDLGQLRGAARLAGRPAALGGFFVEDARGNRLLDLRSEPAHVVALALPAGEPLFVRTYDDREAALRLAPGATVTFAELPLAASARRRGAIDLSLHQGLFATSYGPRYYRGFVDRNEGLPAVPVRDDKLALLDAPPPPPPRPPRDDPRGEALIGAGVALGVAGVFCAGLAAQARADYDRDVEHIERIASDANRRFIGFQAAAAVALAASLASVALGVWRIVRAHRR